MPWATSNAIQGSGNVWASFASMVELSCGRQPLTPEYDPVIQLLGIGGAAKRPHGADEVERLLRYPYRLAFDRSLRRGKTYPAEIQPGLESMEGTTLPSFTTAFPYP